MRMHAPFLHAVGAALALTGAAATAIDTLLTPFGHRPAQCILEVPSGARVEEDALSADVIITHPTLGSWRHTPDPICSQPEYAPAPKKRAPGPVGGPPGNQSCQHMPCTCDSLPCNNWIDNAGWMLDPYDKGPFIGGFSTVMSVPGSPTKKNSGQTLFYFPGAENTDGTPRQGSPPPSGRAILQPVLTYGPETNCKGSTPASETGWCIASWYCCPKNLTVHSPYIGSVAPGQSWLGMFNLTSEGMFETVSRNTKTGQETKLACPRQGRNFNWADVTLEVYGAASCSEFAVGPMKFSEIALWDEHGEAMEPQWLTTKDKPCGGTVTLDSNTSITIEHGGPDH